MQRYIEFALNVHYLSGLWLKQRIGEGCNNCSEYWHDKESGSALKLRQVQQEKGEELQETVDKNADYG